MREHDPFSRARAAAGAEPQAAAEAGEHVSWPAEGVELVGVAVDLVSGQRYRLWHLTGPPSQVRVRLRSKLRPAFFVEDAASGIPLAQFATWEQAVAWHDRKVISCGWLGVLPRRLSEAGARPAERPDQGAVAFLPRRRDPAQPTGASSGGFSPAQ